MNFILNKYAFASLYRFQESLNELDELLDKESHIKITKQYELFDSMYKKTVKIYGIKHRLDLRYVRDRLIKLNKSNPEFTKIPIKIEVNQIKDDAIHMGLLPGACLDAGHLCWYDKYYKKSILNVIRQLY